MPKTRSLSRISSLPRVVVFTNSNGSITIATRDPGDPNDPNSGMKAEDGCTEENLGKLPGDSLVHLPPEFIPAVIVLLQAELNKIKQLENREASAAETEQ